MMCAPVRPVLRSLRRSVVPVVVTRATHMRQTSDERPDGTLETNAMP